MDKKAIVLSVAGSDSSGGAGIQADIKAISALGGYAATAITAITVQNTLGVQAVHPVAAELVGQQMQAVMEDLQPDAIKIGMTGNVEIIYEIVRDIRRFPVIPILMASGCKSSITACICWPTSSAATG